MPSLAAVMIEVVSGNCLRKTGIFPDKLGDFSAHQSVETARFRAADSTTRAGTRLKLSL